MSGGGGCQFKTSEGKCRCSLVSCRDCKEFFSECRLLRHIQVVECECCSRKLSMCAYRGHLDHCIQFYYLRHNQHQQPVQFHPPRDNSTWTQNTSPSQVQSPTGRAEPVAFVVPTSPKHDAQEACVDPFMQSVQATPRVVKTKIVPGIQLCPLLSTLTSREFEFEIEEIKQKLRDQNVYIDSKSFHCMYGYKMCIRVYLNGYGDGKGTHISVFFVIMRGEFDHRLQWPFNRMVMLELINEKITVREAIQPDPKDIAFQKPQSDMNVASGFPKFVPLYDCVQCNSIVIRCIVGSPM